MGLEKREIEVMWNYYYGMSKVEMIWEEEMQKLHKSKVIKKIYEIVDFEFNEIWYLVRDNKEKSYIIKSKCGSIYAKEMMKKYQKIYEFYCISAEIIKIFEKGYFPIVFKLSEEKYHIFYNEKNNVNNKFLNNFYCHTENHYKAVREFRNKVEFEIFEKEEQAIYWCSDYLITKEKIENSNSMPLDLFEMVCEYKL